MAVKPLACELVKAGRNTERLGILAELGAIQGDGKQEAGYSDAEPHKRNERRAQRKKGGRKKVREQQEDEFGCF